MSGYVGDLSSQQEQALRKFKGIVASFPNKPEDNDGYYLRWLRARSFDVDKAVNMFRKHLEWRKEYDVDNLSQWTPPEVLTKFLPGGFFGEDRDGHPVYYEFIGYTDFGGFMRSEAKEEDVIKYKILQGEESNRVFREFSQKKGKCIDSSTVICNLEDLSYQRHFHWPCINLARLLFKGFADNYPERMKAVFVVNAPSIFPIAYNLVKRFMDERTKEKIIVMGNDWQEQLQRYIAPDQLPQAYGGTRCEPDPRCTDYLNWGGDIPEQYFVSNLMQSKKEDMENVVVGRGSTFQLEVEVEIVGTAISWEYLTCDYDIGFGVFYKPKEMKNRKLHASDMKKIVPTNRSNCHEIPESGMHQCKQEGTYVLRFDNTYSWTHSKQLYYMVQVLPPDVELCHPQQELAVNKEEEFVDCSET